jgi:probable phosphoglycerate mutase
LTGADAMPRPVIYFIRHGETDWNAGGILQGQTDIPLNDRGRKQAHQCGLLLRDLLARDGRDTSAVDYVSSPLGRARQTMELIRAALGLPPGDYRVEPRLAEISFGEWEGSTIAQLRQREPQRVAAREHDKWRFKAPGGESYEEMSRRVRHWYDELGGDVIVIAHGGIARGLMASLDIVQAAAAPLVDIAQGVVYVFADATVTRHA